MGFEFKRITSNYRSVWPGLCGGQHCYNIVPMDKQCGKRSLWKRRLHRHFCEPTAGFEPLCFGNGKHRHFECVDPLCELFRATNSQYLGYVEPQYRVWSGVLREWVWNFKHKFLQFSWKRCKCKRGSCRVPSVPTQHNVCRDIDRSLRFRKHNSNLLFGRGECPLERSRVVSLWEC